MRQFSNITSGIFGINTTGDISKIVSNFTRLRAHEITYNNFEISLVVFMPNITTNHAITYTNHTHDFKIGRAILKPPNSVCTNVYLTKICNLRNERETGC